MDGGAVGGTPYNAVLALAAWAVGDFTYLDGALRRDGIDIEEALRWPLCRFVALLHALAIDRTAMMEKADAEAVRAMLEWPEAVEAKADEENQRILDRGLAHLGVQIDFDAFARQRAAEAERAQRMQDGDPAAGHNVSVTDGPA